MTNPIHEYVADRLTMDYEPIMLSSPTSEKTVKGPEGMSPPSELSSRTRMSFFDRTYKRDKRGRFGSGAGGVRDSLEGARTTEQVGQVLAAELHATMGRPVDVNLQGLAPGIAREYAEGLLRGAEQFPDNTLTSVTTFGGKGAKTTAEMGPGAGHAFAITTGYNTHEVAFNAGMSAQSVRAKLAKRNEEGYLVADSPTGAALHEFGHVVTIQHPAVFRGANRLAHESAQAAGDTFFNHIGRHISGYGAASEDEMVAEAFTNVMVNGPTATVLSHDIYDVIVRANK